MLNRIVIMGRLTRDPELRRTQNGTAVTSFSVAADRDFKSRASGAKATDFIDVVAWRSTAEFVCKYFRKGRRIAIQRSIPTRTYVDKDNNKRKAVEVVADSVHFSEPKRDSAASGSTYHSRPDSMEPAAPAYSNGSVGDFEEIPSDDDLPF